MIGKLYPKLYSRIHLIIVENNEEIMNPGEHMAAKYNCIPVHKDKAVLGSKKQEWVKAEFKTGANSTSPNVNWLGESTTPSKEPIEATMQFGDISDDQPNGKGNIKKPGRITRS